MEDPVDDPSANSFPSEANIKQGKKHNQIRDSPSLGASSSASERTPSNLSSSAQLRLPVCKRCLYDNIVRDGPVERKLLVLNSIVG